MGTAVPKGEIFYELMYGKVDANFAQKKNSVQLEWQIGLGEVSKGRRL